MFTAPPILAQLDSEQQTILETDASDNTLAAELSEVYDKMTRPVAFLSRKLSPGQTHKESLSTRDRQTLATPRKETPRYPCLHSLRPQLPVHLFSIEDLVPTSQD
jgi:hypothetical protein